MKLNKALLALAMGLALSVPAGCTDESPKNNKITEADKAKVAADSVTFTENAEINNIKRRLQLTSDPGLMGFVVLLNETGQPVMYTSVKGKITSGGKRLTATDTASCTLNDDAPCGTVRAAPGDEGTYGQSGDYVFFWTQDGQYIQWNGKYLYSDKPFRLTTEPMVISVTQ